MPVNAKMDKPVTANAIRYIEGRWKVTCGGYRATGSVSGSDHPKGLAVDAMTRDLRVGNEIEGWALAHPDCTYTIWQRRYKTPGGVNQPYTGPSPHIDHVHISFRGTGDPGAPSGGQSSGGGRGEGQGLIDALASLVAAPAKMIAWLTDRNNWFRAGGVIVGVFLLVIGMLRLAVFSTVVKAVR